MARCIARSVLAAQADMIKRIVASEPGGVSCTRIAEAAGFHGSMISKLQPETSDPRELTYDQTRRLADAFGWDVVLGPAAYAAGYAVERVSMAPAADPMGASLELVGLSASLAGQVRAALSDGRISRDEAEGIVRAVSAVIDTAGSVGAAARPQAA